MLRGHERHRHTDREDQRHSVDRPHPGLPAGVADDEKGARPPRNPHDGAGPGRGRRRTRPVKPSQQGKRQSRDGDVGQNQTVQNVVNEKVAPIQLTTAKPVMSPRCAGTRRPDTQPKSAATIAVIALHTPPSVVSADHVAPDHRGRPAAPCAGGLGSENGPSVNFERR